MTLRRPNTAFVGALAAAALALSACGGNSAPSSGAVKTSDVVKIKIGWIPPNTTGVFQTATQYFQLAAKEANKNGFDVQIVTQAPTGGEANTAGLNQIMENMISQRVDVITVSPGDTEAIKPAVRRANEAGIPVVYVNLLDVQKDVKVDAYVGFDNVSAAKVSAYALLDYLGGPGVLGAGEKVKVDPSAPLDIKWWENTYAKVDGSSIKGQGIVIEGVKGTIYSTQRLQGFNEVLSKFPNVKVLGTLPGAWERGKGGQATEDLLTRYPNAGFVWAASNEMAFGAINVLSPTGRLGVNPNGGPPTAGKVAVFTNDNTPESTDAIRKGQIIAETTHGFPDWGWVGTSIAVKLVCKEQVEVRTDINPRTVYFGNPDQFYPDPKLPTIDWSGIRSNCKK